MTEDPGRRASPPLPPGRRVELPGRGKTWIWEATGPPGAPTLLLLHGWTVTAALNWFQTLPALAERYHVVAMDLRGHGRGIRSRRPFRLEACADDAEALCEVLGVPTVIPVGYSMGGPIAQLLWRRHRARVAGMVLCATAGGFATRSLLAPATWVFGRSLAVGTCVLPPFIQQELTRLALRDRLGETPLAEWAAAERRRNDLAALIGAGVAAQRVELAALVGRGGRARRRGQDDGRSPRRPLASAAHG